MRTSRAIASIPVLFALLATPAAADLAPKRASDVVNLRLESGPCLGNADWANFSTRALAGGQQVPFQVPKGKVLVVRRVEVQLSANTAESVAVSILAGLPGTPYSYANRLFVATGAVDLEFLFPVGFVVPEGGSVCVLESTLGPANGKLDGHLAPAR